MDATIKYIEEHHEKFLDELMELLRIPSVSADSTFKDDVFEAAEYIKEKLEAAGADNVELCPTDGYPIVYGEKIIDKALPTVLVYGHYDVQPADPYDLWDSPPFEPVIKNEKIYARGACDDKGQLYMHVKSFEAMMQTDTLPCNLKFMIEGEEEVGSVNLEAFARENKEKLAADVVLISDTSMISNDTPSITVGLKGLSFVEVELTGPAHDLHSGTYGGAVGNPANILCRMVASLHDENNRIKIHGFYDKVKEVPAEERREMAKAPFDEEAYKKELDIGEVHGEAGYSTLERATIRPTLDVNGMWSGYTGEGAKTILPSRASAKISMRLVPDQDPDEIGGLFEKHFKSLVPPSVKVSIKRLHKAEPVLTPTDSDAYKAASKAMEKTFGKKPIPMRSGGSIPIVAMFERVLGIKSLLLGFGLDTDGIHSPNERYGLFNFYKGMETIPWFFHYFSRKSG